MDRVLHLLSRCTNNQVPAKGPVIYGIPEDEGRDCQFVPPDDQPVLKTPSQECPLWGEGCTTDWQETSVLSSGAGMPISVPSAGKGHTLQQNAQDS